MGEIWTRFKNFRKNFPICFCKLLKQNHRPEKLSYSFSSKWRKNSGKLKIFPREAQGSRMPLVRAVYHGLVEVRRGCNDGGQGAQFRGRRVIMRAPNDIGGPKSPNNVTSTSVQYICFRKTSGSNMGTPNLLLASVVIWPRCAPSSNSILFCVVHVYEVRSCTVTVGHNSLS